MVDCIFRNLSKEQAIALAEYLDEGLGVMNYVHWFEEFGLNAPIADASREGGFIEEDKNGNLVVYCTSGDFL